MCERGAAIGSALAIANMKGHAGCVHVLKASARHRMAATAVTAEKDKAAALATADKDKAAALVANAANAEKNMAALAAKVTAADEMMALLLKEESSDTSEGCGTSKGKTRKASKKNGT